MRRISTKFSAFSPLGPVVQQRPAHAQQQALSRQAQPSAPKKIPLDRELANLSVQVVDLRLMLLGGLAPAVPGEDLRHGVQKLPLLGAHLVGMKLVLHGDRLARI